MVRIRIGTHSLALILLVWTVHAQSVWHVSATATPPGDGSLQFPFPTIQAGVAMASTGDTIRVGRGVYHERHISMPSGTTLIAPDGPQATVVHGDDLDPIILASAGSAIIGLTVTHGRGAAGLAATEFEPGGRGGGGGIQFNGPLQVIRCIIVDNRGGAGGDGYVGGYPFVVQSPGPGAGGGIDGSGDLLLVDTIVTQNVGGDRGGFPWNTGIEVGAGGVHAFGSATIIHCTFTANSGGTPTGGPDGGAPGGLISWGGVVLNSIFWDDSGSNTIGPSPGEFIGDSLDVRSCDVSGAYPGVGNVSLDPRFVRAPGSIGFEAGFGLHLRSDSPCRGAGTLDVPGGLPATDLDGDPRVCGPAAALPDMGADEWLGGTEDGRALLGLQVNGAGLWTEMQKHASVGDMVVARFQGTAFGPCALVGQAFASGLPPSGYAGVLHVDPASAIFVFGAPISPFGLPLMPPAGIDVVFLVPPGVAGITCRLQGVVIDPLAANGGYSLSPAVDLILR